MTDDNDTDMKLSKIKKLLQPVRTGPKRGSFDSQVMLRQRKEEEEEIKKNSAISFATTLELPEELLKELKWKAGDEIEVSSTENCFDWGEVKSLVLRNLSKEKK